MHTLLIPLWAHIPMHPSQNLIEANLILMLEPLVITIFSIKYHFKNLISFEFFDSKFLIFIGHIDHGKTTLTAAITKHLATKGNVIFSLSITIFKQENPNLETITILIKPPKKKLEVSQLTLLQLNMNQIQDIMAMLIAQVTQIM